jgi:hypothetical protein
MEAAEARTVCRQAAASRRKRLADSGLTDSGTRTLIYLCDNVRIITGKDSRTIIASLDHVPLSDDQRRHVDSALVWILDPVDGDIHPLNPLSYSLTLDR